MCAVHRLLIVCVIMHSVNLSSSYAYVDPEYEEATLPSKRTCSNDECKSTNVVLLFCYIARIYWLGGWGRDAPSVYEKRQVCWPRCKKI